MSTQNLLVVYWVIFQQNFISLINYLQNSTNFKCFTLDKTNAEKIKEFRAIEIIRITSKWTVMNIINNNWASKVNIQSLKTLDYESFKT